MDSGKDSYPIFEPLYHIHSSGWLFFPSVLKDDLIKGIMFSNLILEHNWVTFQHLCFEFICSWGPSTLLQETILPRGQLGKSFTSGNRSQIQRGRRSGYDTGFSPTSTLSCTRRTPQECPSHGRSSSPSPETPRRTTLTCSFWSAGGCSSRPWWSQEQSQSTRASQQETGSISSTTRTRQWAQARGSMWRWKQHRIIWMCTPGEAIYWRCKEGLWPRRKLGKLPSSCW